jgi:hypothetical protein
MVTCILNRNHALLPTPPCTCNYYESLLPYTVEIFNFSCTEGSVTKMGLKNAVFWDVAPCSSRVNGRFGGTYRLHLQGRKIRARETSMSRWLQTYRRENLNSYTEYRLGYTG